MTQICDNLDTIIKVIHDDFRTHDQNIMNEIKDGKIIASLKIHSETGYTSYLYKFDNTERLLPFFKKEKGLGRMCDYVLFSQGSKKILYVLLVELKGEDSSLDQLKAAELFVQYIVDSAKRIELPFSDDHVRFCKIRIKNPKNPKMPYKHKIKEGLFVIDPHGQMLHPGSEFRLNKVIDTINSKL